MTIAVDFDGTIVENKYPEIGKEKAFAIHTLITLQQEGNKIILFTSREGDLLAAAIDFCHERGLDFYAVNSNDPPEAMFPRQTAKVIADVYIDDRNLGGIPDDWNEIYEMIGQKRLERREKRKKKSRWPWKR